MSDVEKESKEAIDLKDIRKKLEAKIEEALPEEFKKRHEPKAVEEIDLEGMREVDEITAKRIIEALLFSSAKPVTVNDIKKILRGYKPSKVENLIRDLQAEYERESRSFRIHEVAGGFELATLVEYYQWLKKLDLQKKGKAASFAALETLAVLAYKQPVTRGEIEELRGVDVSGTIATLLERNFIKIVGRKEVPGRPLLYATTDFFLQHFGLRALSDLPRVHEIKEIVAAAIKRETLMEQELVEEQLQEQARKKELEAAEVAELTRQREEIKQRYEEIAGEVEGVKVMRPREMSDIVNPQEEQGVAEGEVSDQNRASEPITEGDAVQDAADGADKKNIREYETKIIKTTTEGDDGLR